jgi:hypothetical protein
MSMPRFTAEHALHGSGRRYRAAATSDGAPPRLRPAAAVECVQPWDVDEYHPEPESVEDTAHAHGALGDGLITRRRPGAARGS